MELTEDPLAAIDAEELESDIDKAIDELFVKKGEPQQPAIAEEAPTEEPVAEPSVEPTPLSSAEPEDDSLAELKEKLLTLDWEISAENIHSFEKELQSVSDKLSDDRHSLAVIKMALGVIQYLRAAKDSAAPISVQFLHAATRGLDVFVKEPAPTDAERNQVMDKLLGQFRRVKAEIQRMKPAAPAATPPPEEPVLEPVLEEVPEQEPILDELPMEEAALEEISAEESILEDLPEEEPALEELLEEELLEEELPFEEISEEDLELSALLEEEVPLEEIGAEEPIFDELPLEEPSLEEISAEEQVLEAPAAEEPALEVSPEEEPVFAAPVEEEPPLEETPEAESILAESFEQEPVLDELLEEEQPLGEVPEEIEPLDELLEEEPALEPSLELPDIAVAPVADPDEIPASVQQLTQEVDAQIGQLSNALQALGQESNDFFGQLLKAMTGKPALEKLERRFSTAHKAMEDRLADANEVSGNIGEALTRLEHRLGQQQTGVLAPRDQAEIDSQVRIIQDAVSRFTRASERLSKSLAGRSEAATPGIEAVPLAPTKVDTEEFSLHPEDAMESLGAEPLLDLVEEIPSETPSQASSSVATIYLADVANSTLGIPTDAVISVFKVSKGKAKAARKRGYAKLADFKSGFRSIKKGITGPLADLKVKELKKIRFPIITLSPETLGSDDTQAEALVKGIVLLSNGERHGALFTNEIMQRTPYEVKGYRKAGLPDEVSGTAIIEGDFEINVVHTNRVLS